MGGVQGCAQFDGSTFLPSGAPDEAGVKTERLVRRRERNIKCQDEWEAVGFPRTRHYDAPDTYCGAWPRMMISVRGMLLT